jgi:CCR4-NOT complex subunit CAF16
MQEPAISVSRLSFTYPGEARPVLSGLSLAVPARSRALLIGANGAGKSTLLSILAGHYLIDPGAARVLGRPAFHDTALAEKVTFLGGEFPFRSDVAVSEILARRPGRDPEREARLLKVLGVEPRWRMHRVSDGQRRRVQILLGLLRPSEVLLLDEVTTDLDVVARADLLAFLREETEARGATILYATHILDGLDAWATHLAYLAGGEIRLMSGLAEIPELAALRAQGASSPLLRLVDRWLRAGNGR